MYKYYSLVRATVVALSICTVLVFGFMTIAYIKLSNRSTTLHELSKLKTQINLANMYIRNASIAASVLDRDRELAKRFETRAVADTAYIALDKQNLKSEELAIYNAMKLARNTTYRTTQNIVVDLILADAPDKLLWPKVIEYQKYQMQYISSIEKLAGLILNDIETSYKRLLESFMAFIGIVLLGANIAITYIGRNPRERRRCNVCECKLPQKISLTISREVDGKIGPVRVCETCYFTNTVRLKIPEV